MAVWPLPETDARTADDVLEAWLEHGPPAPRHTLVQGRFVVENGQLVAANAEDMRRRHDAITRDWQRFADAR
jgi:hypothetical protein